MPALPPSRPVPFDPLGVLLVCWGGLVGVNYVADPLHWKRILLTFDAVRIWSNAPFNIDRLLGVMPDHLLAIGSTIACLGVGALAGGGPAAWFGVADRPLRLALGLGGGSLAILGLGLTGLFLPWVIWATSAGMALSGWFLARLKKIEPRSRLEHRDPGVCPRWVVRSAVALAGVSAALNGLGGLAPETGYDSLIQHLADPRAYLALHRIAFNDLSFLAQHPAGIELLYAAVLPTGGDQAAKLLHGSLAGLTCWTVFVWLKRRMAGRDALCLACILYLTPFTGILSARAYIDHGLTFYAAATLLAPAGTILQGVLIGLAIGTKYLGGFLLLAWAGAFLAAGRPRAFIRVAAGASLVAGCWGVRNWFNTGNPVYPFAHALLGGLAWDSHSASEYGQELGAYGKVVGWIGHFAIPWMAGVRDHGALDDGSLGPLWLMGAPLLLVTASRASTGPERILHVTVAALWGLWLVSPRQVRYALMLLPLTLAMLAPALVRVRDRWPTGWRLAVGCLPLVLFVQLQISFAAVYLWVNPLYVVGGMIHRGEYLARIMEPRDSKTGRSLYCDLPMAFAATLPATARTYMVGDAKVYYLPGDWLVNALFNPPLLARIIRTSRTPDEVAKRLRQRGITHLLYNVGGSIHIEYTHRMFRWTDREFALLDQFVTSWWKPLSRLPDSNGDPMYLLFQVVPGRFPDPPYLPGIDTRLAGVEMLAFAGDHRGAREAAEVLVREFPSSAWIRRRTTSIINRKP